MNTRRALAFIFCTVTLDVLALGVMIPVLPRIVLGFMDGDIAGAANFFGQVALHVLPAVFVLYGAYRYS